MNIISDLSIKGELCSWYICSRKSFHKKYACKQEFGHRISHIEHTYVAMRTAQSTLGSQSLHYHAVNEMARLREMVMFEWCREGRR